MKTLYKQFIGATVIILICSIGIGFALANVMYFTFTKDKTDAQNVETAQHIVDILEQTHRSEQAMDAYLASVGELGYQICCRDRTAYTVRIRRAFFEKKLTR